MTEFEIIESISKKLNSPTGQTLTKEEALVMEQLRQKISDSPHLRVLEQFFANSVIVEDPKE
jgi:hypothetical protein